MVVLDTDHMSLLEWGDVGDSMPLRTRLAALPPAEVATTIISYEEQMRGWMAYIARTGSLTHQVKAYRRLRRARIRIGTMDLKIAGIALSHGAVLLSRNLVDFRQIPHLQVEDWTS